MFAFFENLLDPFPEDPVRQPPQGFVAYCWYFTRSAWKFIVVMSLIGVAAALTEVAMFAFLGNVVDWLTKANRATFLSDESARLWVMGLVILVLYPALALAHALVMHQTIFGNYPMIMRWMSHRYLLGQSLSFYQDEFAGRIATKVMQGALGVRETVLKVMDVLVYVLVYFLGGLALVAWFDWRLALPFVVWLGVYLTVLYVFLPRMAEVSRRQADARSLMTGRMVDSYTNIMTVKLFAHAGREVAYSREAMDGFMQTVHPMMRIATHLHVWLSLINSMLLFSVGAVGIALWLNTAATAGEVAVGIGLVMRLKGISHWIMWEMSGLFENIGMVKDSIGTVSQPVDVVDRPGARDLIVREGKVEFDNIRFNYGRDLGVIDGLSLTIRPGEKVGIVGRSGAGKTTLMNVLLRLYDLEDGRVLIDGQDIADVGQESLRAQIGVVTQDTSLLHRSVAENIAYADDSAGKQAIEAAARKAQADDFIADLVDPKGRRGFDAHVGERGVKLSGGQRQRIAIARCFLKDAPILVLDEATSALDSEVEAAIQDNLHALMDGKTVIAIAHRLSTISALDRLVVLDRGKIVEEGSHEELVARGGLYASLWNRQSGGFLGEQVA